MAKRLFKAQSSVPLLFAVLVFAGYSWDLTPANNEGRLYLIVSSFYDLGKLESKRLWSLQRVSEKDQ